MSQQDMNGLALPVYVSGPDRPSPDWYRGHMPHSKKERTEKKMQAPFL
jgi:hypothetical protein